MAKSSKFYNLSSELMLEYEYHDPAAAAQGYTVKGDSNHVDYPDDPRGPIIETDLNDARIHILANQHNGSNHFFFEENPGINTDLYHIGNYLRRSTFQVDDSSNKYALIDDNIALNYLDYDEKLTGVDDLDAQLTGEYNTSPKKNMVYDTVRVHLVNGYDISSRYGGWILEMDMLDANELPHYFSSLLYLNTDNFEKINPRPFILGGVLYNKYIEFKVPSLKWMEDEWDEIINLGGNTANTFVHDFTSGVGPFSGGNINVRIKFIDNIYQNGDGYTFFDAVESLAFNLNREDEYSALEAVIEEADDGDYFKLYGQHNGEIFENFIAELANQENADYSVFHDIQVFEQIAGDTSTSQFVETTNMTFVQTSDFEDPFMFRPIIKNANIAVSYRIEYNLRLYNTVNNTQIIKRSSYGSFDTRKYGKKMKRINLGTVPTVTKVYNVIDKLPVMEVK